MFDRKKCVHCLGHSDAFKPDSFGLPFLPQPFCPSANARRQHTRDGLIERRIPARSSRSGAVVDTLKVVGKKLHVGSEELPLSQTHCGRPAAFGDEHRALPALPGSGYYDSTAKCHGSSTIQLSTVAANTDKHCNCCESRNCRPHTRMADDSVDECQSICQHAYSTHQQQASFISELDKTDECSEIDEVEPEISAHNSTRTYRNARVDQNRLLKLLRKFDTIRQRARAAREACLVRLEMRQKRRLHLIDSVDSEYQQKDASQEVNSNDRPPPLGNDTTASATVPWDNVGVNGGTGRKVDVKLRDVIDLCGRARSDNFVTTWPPLLDDATTSVEPRDAVISRLMSQFQQIRLDGLTARHENRKRFENKRKERKYKI